MKVVEVDGLLAHCEARGAGRTVSLVMLAGDDPVAGDFVVVHLGHAIERISEERALAAWEIYDRMLAVEHRGDGG